LAPVFDPHLAHRDPLSDPTAKYSVPDIAFQQGRSLTNGCALTRGRYE